VCEKISDEDGMPSEVDIDYQAVLIAADVENNKVADHIRGWPIMTHIGRMPPRTMLCQAQPRE
jgi:hypothetical protein